VKRKKYFDGEQAFRFIWENTDGEGIWRGDAASLAGKFDASQNEAESVLEELRDRRLIERLSDRTYFISGWREKDDHDANHE
jgi:hypothetical protein